jgi:AcrR family transcriptional regulator
VFLVMSAGNPFEPREVTSRRGGPVKTPLSREVIVATALALLKREGLGGMQMRKVAAALETGPASLYAYVDDANALQALVLDRALGDVDVTGGNGSWRQRVRTLLASYLAVLSGTPGLGQLALATIAVGPNALRLYESLLGLLLKGGIHLERASFAVDMLLLYCTALAAERGNGVDPDDPEGPLVRAIMGASPSSFPLIHESREVLLSGTGEERVSWGLDVLINGILQTARPEARARRAPAAGPRKTRKTER